MDPSLEDSIFQAFKECQQWTQQFIVDDSGGSVDLSCASTKESPRTPDNAKNQPLLYPDCSVYQFDPTFRGKESFQALVLMIQNSLHGSKFSFVQGSRNNRFVLWCPHTRVQEKKQTDTHAFDNDHFTQEGVNHEHIKRKRTKLESSLDAMTGKQESKAIKCSTSSMVSHYSDNQPSNCRVHSICKTDKKDCCKCRIAFFPWRDGFFYLDHKTTCLTTNGHPAYTPEMKLKGIKYISDYS